MIIMVRAKSLVFRSKGRRNSDSTGWAVFSLAVTWMSFILSTLLIHYLQTIRQDSVFINSIHQQVLYRKINDAYWLESGLSIIDKYKHVTSNWWEAQFLHIINQGQPVSSNLSIPRTQHIHSWYIVSLISSIMSIVIYWFMQALRIVT